MKAKPWPLDLLWLPRDSHLSVRMPKALRAKLIHDFNNPKRGQKYLDFSDYVVAVFAKHCRFGRRDEKRFRDSIAPSPRAPEPSMAKKPIQGGPSRYFIKDTK